MDLDIKFVSLQYDPCAGPGCPDTKPYVLSLYAQVPSKLDMVNSLRVAVLEDLRHGRIHHTNRLIGSRHRGQFKET